MSSHIAHTLRNAERTEAGLRARIEELEAENERLRASAVGVNVGVTSAGGGIGAMVPETDTFILEAAIQYGFEQTDDDDMPSLLVENYRATGAQIIALVKAARKQGREDATPTPVRMTAKAVEALAMAICTDVAELPDRDSPDDWPEAMLVTDNELLAIVENHVVALFTPNIAGVGVNVGVSTVPTDQAA